MNRAIALFVALAMLLAHTLAIHGDGEGRFAPPYDQAYVALRIARNLVYDGQLAWNLGSSAFESYPSALWVGVCAVAERIAPTLRVSTNVLVQLVGTLCAVSTLVVLARFRTDRVATLIAPLFLATSGAFAAAAANGLETTLFTLLVLGSFFALERGNTKTLAVLLVLACATRFDGLLLAAGLAILRALGRPNDDEGRPRRVEWPVFLAPLITFCVMALVRWRTTGFLLPSDLDALLRPTLGQWSSGIGSAREFALVTVTPLLLVFPAAYMVRGALSRTGTHAVFLSLFLGVLTTLRGRGTLPFHEAFVPVLPLVFLAVQEGMIAALDSTSVLRRRIAWLGFGLGIFGSVLASRPPQDLGPLPLGRLHAAWVKPVESPRFGYEQPLARLGLDEEIAVTMRLRKVGIFLREQIEQGTSVLTPWPGAIGYLSRQTVLDPLGRASPLAVLDRPRNWSRREHADLAAALRTDADFAVPFCTLPPSLPTLAETAVVWMAGLDSHPDGAARRAEIERELARYELVTVPIEDYTQERVSMGRETFLLLRNRRLGFAPRLRVEAQEGVFKVTVGHSYHPQIAELAVRLTDSAGAAFSLRPTGELDADARARARVRLLLYDSGTREVELMRGTLPAHPAGLEWAQISAQLLNPGARDTGDPWEAAGERAFAGL